jgi:TusA-related sulfurtransferase
MSEVRNLDLRGVACPLNFVKTKLLIDKLNIGDSVEVLLDKGEPVESVCSSMQAEGHQLVSREETGDGHYRVLIRKAGL